jgi:hypothetical protein
MITRSYSKFIATEKMDAARRKRNQFHSCSPGYLMIEG